jgi:hypothetical protein
MTRAARRASIAALCAPVFFAAFCGTAISAGAVPVGPHARAPLNAAVAKDAPVAKSGWASLPVGPARGYPFGYTSVQVTKISLLPPNADDVDQIRVAKAPRLGPFRINTKAGLKAWPNACALTGLAQLKALFPAITGLKGAPLGTNGHPNDTDCKFSLRTVFDPRGYVTPSWVDISLERIGPRAQGTYSKALAQQEAMAHKYPAQYAGYPDLSNGVKCFDDGNELQCLKDEAYYWVIGHKVTGGAFVTSDQAVWTDQIEIPLAEVIAAEVSTTP